MKRKCENNFDIAHHQKNNSKNHFEKKFKNEFENDFIIKKIKSIQKINITYQKRNFNQNSSNKQFNIFVSFSSIKRDRKNKIIENVCYHCDKNDH